MCDLFTGFIKDFMGLSKIIMPRKDTASPVPSQQLPWVIGSLSATQDRVYSVSVIFVVINYNHIVHIF